MGLKIMKQLVVFAENFEISFWFIQEFRSEKQPVSRLISH